MASTPHTGITLLEQAQAQKEMTMNEALQRIDALLNMGVVDRDLATPPASPLAGAVYLVAANPTDAWSGKAGQVAYFDQIWRFVVPQEGLLLWVNDENLHVVYNGSAWQVLSNSSSTGKAMNGRLTLTSGVPVTTGDVSGAANIYFTPYGGNEIALYTGSAWTVLAFAEITLPVPTTTNSNYDVFAYNNAGSVALEALAWTNATTRATALAMQDGVYVKSGAPARRYLGTFRTGSVGGQVHDSRAKRLLWNYYHRMPRLLARVEASSWTYNVANWRMANNNAANMVEFVQGVSEAPVRVTLNTVVSNSTPTPRFVALGIGFDSTTTPSQQYAQTDTSATGKMLTAYYEDTVSAGYHYCSWLEYGGGTDTQTWFGTAVFGLTGTVVA